MASPELFSSPHLVFAGLDFLIYTMGVITAVPEVVVRVEGSDTQMFHTMPEQSMFFINVRDYDYTLSGDIQERSENTEGREKTALG